jgi:outer membrane protein OmpA-like peptidoglycan-associated protein
MTKTLAAAALAVTLAIPAFALDLGSAAAQMAGNAAGDQAMAALTQKLKDVQNDKGPIVFKTGKATLDASKCEKTLKSIDGIIKQYPGFKVQVEGYTDNKGKAASNLKLSQGRAEAVVAWLTGHLQTPAERLSAKGFGDAKPIADNKTKAGQAKNRRVEFSVTKM